MGGMMGNKAVKTTMTELNEQQPDDADLDIEFVSETKDIQGYKCKKAVLTGKDGQQAIFWYTEEIEINKAGQSYLNDQIPGFPMEFEINQGGMKMSMKATFFEKKIPGNASELFSMEIPAGYQEMSLNAMQSMGM
jgi:GLPGLI family protein